MNSRVAEMRLPELLRFAMRTRISIGLTALIVVVTFALARSSASAPPVSLAFAGYSDDGRSARFEIKNHTRHDVYFSMPVIQLPIAGGWTNYVDPIESRMLRCGFPALLPRRQRAALSATLPERGQWRAAVRCTVNPSEEPTSLRGRLQWLLEIVGLRNTSTKTELNLVTDEFVK